METLVVATMVADAIEKTKTRGQAIDFWKNIPKGYRKQVLQYIKYQELEIIESALEKGTINENQYIIECDRLK